MPTRKLSSSTPGQRHARLFKSDAIDKPNAKHAKHAKKLKHANNYNTGRNSRGVITMRHKGGRVKRKYRVIDFSRDKLNVPGEIVAIEYDPNRTANIALVKYADGEYRYIIAPNGLGKGDTVVTSTEYKGASVGNSYPLKAIPAATYVHNVELVPGNGAVLARSAGSSIQIQGAVDKGYIQIKLPSGEIRLVNGECYATIGTVSNTDHGNEKVGKAGRNRRRGIRPTVRGVAQSYKHPHAGGQGKSGRTGTGRPSKDPWGNKRGVVTRKRKHTNKYIIKRRTSKLRPRSKPYKTIV